MPFRTTRASDLLARGAASRQRVILATILVGANWGCDESGRSRPEAGPEPGEILIPEPPSGGPKRR